MRTVVVCLLAALSATPVGQHHQSLGPADVQVAIADGLSGKTLKPYQIGRWDLGRAYTPYLRVAFAARSARDTYQSFEPSQVTAEMIAPLIYVHVPARDTWANGLEKRSTANRPMDRYVDVETVLVMPKGEKDPSKAIRPTWIKPIDVALQNLFGAQLTASGFLAAFPPECVGDPFEFVVVYVRPLGYIGTGPGGRELRGQITDKKWK